MKHPILGYNKMHRGTDFAAPTERQSWPLAQVLLQEQDGVAEGNCIKIKHNSTYETIYAHMKNFARN